MCEIKVGNLIVFVSMKQCVILIRLLAQEKRIYNKAKDARNFHGNVITDRYSKNEW